MSSLLQLFHFAASACGTKTGFLPSLYDGVSCPGGNIDISSVQDVLIIVGNVLRILIALSGVLAIILIILGAIYYITSTGDASRVKRGKDIIINAVLGLVVVIASYAVVTFITVQF